MLDPSAAPLFLALPIFEVVGSARAKAAGAGDSIEPSALPRTKAQLIADPRARPFQCGVFPQQTPSINYAAWLAAGVETEAAVTPPPPPPLLEVTQSDLFEPSGVAAVARLPRWDERFRGYGLNKAALGASLAANGFELRAAAGAFLVTAPHERETTWRAAPGTRRDAEQLERVYELYSKLKTELNLC
jgi:hypothetical protein